MKSIILMTLILPVFVLTSSFAQPLENRNPQHRICKTNYADYSGQKIKLPAPDEIGLCKFEEAYLGSITLIHYFYSNKKTAALKAFYNTKKLKISTCEQEGATTVQGTDSNKTVHNLCVFYDYSFISEKTLVKGWKDFSNLNLVQVLENK